MSLSEIFAKLQSEQKFVHYVQKPSYHSTNKDVIILSTSHVEGNAKGIYEYNIKKNTFTKIYTYKQGFKPRYHGQFIDSKNELLYIFGNGQLGIFDLNTK
eukprot:130807_1